MCVCVCVCVCGGACVSLKGFDNESWVQCLFLFVTLVPFMDHHRNVDMLSVSCDMPLHA